MSSMRISIKKTREGARERIDAKRQLIVGGVKQNSSESGRTKEIEITIENLRRSIHFFHWVLDEVRGRRLTFDV